MLLLRPLAASELSEGIAAESEHATFFRQHDGVIRAARHLHCFNLEVTELADMDRIGLG